MSGLDPRNTGIIVDRLFGKTGYFRRAGISVVMTTHNGGEILLTRYSRTYTV